MSEKIPMSVLQAKIMQFYRECSREQFIELYLWITGNLMDLDEVDWNK